MKIRRSKIGTIIHSTSPDLYNYLVDYTNRIKKIFVRNDPYITDNLGGSFKTYISTFGIKELKVKLFEGLDSVSILEMDLIIERLLTIPDKSALSPELSKYKLVNRIPKLKKLPVEESKSRKAIKGALKKLDSSFVEINMEASVGYFHHGLIFLPKSVLEYIKDGNFIDIGSYIGDSAVALNAYRYKKIFSFDISSKSISEYKLNLKRNGIDDNRFKITQALVSETSGMQFEFTDSGSPGLSVKRDNTGGDLIKVTSVSIDDFCSIEKITPVLIKADMEGHAMEFVKGAVKTLVSCRPVLLIAVYHNPIEFFEIKPFLSSKLSNYTIMMRKLSPYVEWNECHSEVFIIAYPNEQVK